MNNIIFAQALVTPLTTPMVPSKYKPNGTCTYTAPITMVNQHDANATLLPTHPAFAIPHGMLNDSSPSHTLSQAERQKE